MNIHRVSWSTAKVIGTTKVIGQTFIESIYVFN